MVKAEPSSRKEKTRPTKEQLVADRRQTRDSDSSSFGATSASKGATGRGSDDSQYDLKALSADLQAEWKKVARLTSQLDAATEENIRLKNELDSATDSLARNASAATAFSSLDLPQARAALASSKSKLKELEAEVGSTTERVRTLEVELQTSKDESDAVRTKLANAEIASADGEKKALARVDQLLAAVSKMEIKIVTLESERTNLEGKLKSAETKQSTLAKDKAALEARVATAEKKLAQPQKSEDLKEIEKELQEAYDRIDELEGSLLVAERKSGPVGVPAEGGAATLKDKKRIAALEKSLAEVTKERDAARNVSGQPDASSSSELKKVQSELDALKKSAASAAAKAKEADEGLALKKSLLDTLGLGSDLKPDALKKMLTELGFDTGSSTSITSAYRVVLDQASLAKAFSAEVDELKESVAAAQKERDELHAGKKDVEDRLGRRIEELEGKMDGALVNKSSPTPSVAGPSRANGNREPVEMLAKQVVQLNETITELRQENMSLLMQLAGVE